MQLDTLDKKLNDIYAGRVVRKDLLHRVKKGTNIPSFVLEFLLARYCASDDPDEIQAGIDAVFETLQKHYVRPDESNKAQSHVQQKGKHKYIDKLQVRCVEREKRHWAEMENFDSAVGGRQITLRRRSSSGFPHQRPFKAREGTDSSGQSSKSEEILSRRPHSAAGTRTWPA